MSSKTIAQKLQLKPGQRFLIVNPPEGYREALGKLPSNLKILAEPQGSTDVIQVFISSRIELEKQLATLKMRLNSKGIIWVTYPKGPSKNKKEINRDSIREFALHVGLEAVAIFSIDANWSALRLKKV